MSVFAADNVDAWSDDGLIEEFRRSRQEAYAVLARDIEKVLKRATSNRRPSGTRAPAIRRLLEVFRERLTAIERIGRSDWLSACQSLWLGAAAARR